MAFVGVYSVVREVGGSDWGRVGMLTTSWPSTRVPYAGHFVSSMARALVAEGASVAVAAPEFSGDGGLLASESIELVSSPVSGQGGGLVDNKAGWLPTLRALRSAALRVGNCDVWIAHWWPTVAALPLSQRAVVALHGSDVDLLDRMPSWVARSVAKGVASRATVVGVAPHLAYRFNATLGRSEALVCPLGAEPPATMAVPDVASQWRESAKPRVLTVARDAPGKGLSRARQAASMVDEVSWLIADGQPPLSPNEVWALVAAADLLVVPSEDGPNQPREGQALHHLTGRGLRHGDPRRPQPECGRSVDRERAMHRQRARLRGASARGATMRRASDPGAECETLAQRG